MLSTKNGEKLFAWKDMLLTVLGCALMALGVEGFLTPNSITTGGAAGLAVSINHLLPVLPKGGLYLLINLPLIWLAIRRFGLRFLAKTVFGVAVYSLLLEAGAFFPAMTDDPLLACLLGGACVGAGLGLVFSRGYTTGGSDICVWLLRTKLRAFSTGSLVLCLDAAVVTVAALAFGEVETALYSAVTVFLSSKFIDQILGGLDYAKFTVIITDKPEEVANGIMEHLGRGVTYLKGQGCYTGTQKGVLLCAARKYEVHELQTIVSRIDEESFIVFTDASQVRGKGFKELGEE